MIRTHRLWTAIAAALPPLVIAASACSQQAQPAPDVAISNVTVLDLERGTREDNQTVLITGNQFTAVGPASEVPVPNGARTVDGQGKFLMPGLWDMHVHSFEHYGVAYGTGDMKVFQLYVANGVTGVRDMGSSLDQLQVGRRRIERGGVVAPRTVASGPMLEGGQPSAGMAVISKYVPDPHLGGLAISALKEAGVDFGKIHNGLTRDTYFAMAQEAKRLDFMFSGHVPADVTIIEAADVGQRSVEHLAPLAAACTDPVPDTGGQRNPGGEGIPPPPSINAVECAEIIRQLAEHGTYLTPTLVSSLPMTTSTMRDAIDATRYITAAKRRTWPTLSAEARPGAQARHDFNMRLYKMAADGSVRMLTGTDTGGAYRLPGWALIEELYQMVAAGVSPLDALRAATVNPVASMNLSDSLGSIAQNKMADAILLDADPLVDIQNIRRISAVVVNGTLVDAQRREALLREVLAGNTATTP